MSDADDPVFAAIADPTRRAIIRILDDEDDRTSTELGARLGMTRQAVTHHLRHLIDAGVIVGRRRGRRTHYRLVTEPLAAARSWLHDVGAAWDTRLESLKEHVEKPDGAEPSLFANGGDIAIKVPRHHYEATVAFYADTIGLEVRAVHPDSHEFAFGPMRLWVDRMDTYSQADVWLELSANDLDRSMDRLRTAGTPVRDELEPLDGVDGHWISDPAGTVWLVRRP